MRIGFTEFLVILAVALIVLGPDKLPIYMKKFGRALREVKNLSSELSDDLKENIIEPLNEAQRPLREAIEPLNDLDKDIRENIKDMEKSFQNLGKTESVPDTAKPAETNSEPEDSTGTQASDTPENKEETQ